MRSQHSMVDEHGVVARLVMCQGEDGGSHLESWAPCLDCVTWGPGVAWRGPAWPLSTQEGTTNLALNLTGR